jgi:hypothetical protein
MERAFKATNPAFFAVALALVIALSIIPIVRRRATRLCIATDVVVNDAGPDLVESVVRVLDARFRAVSATQ